MTQTEKNPLPNATQIDDQAANKKRLFRFIGFTTGILLFVALVFVVIALLDVLSIGSHGVFALFLGTVFSILIGVSLMALVFYSNRSGHDDRA